MCIRMPAACKASYPRSFEHPSSPATPPSARSGPAVFMAYSAASQAGSASRSKVEYNDGQKGVLKENSLAFYYWGSDRWVREPTSTVNVDTNTVTATPNHFSSWTVLGQIGRVYLPTIKR